MSDTIVTIRLPAGLLTELKRLAKERYFVDESEFVRGILRKEHAKSGSGALSDAVIDDLKKRLKEDAK